MSLLSEYTKNSLLWSFSLDVYFDFTTKSTDKLKVCCKILIYEKNTYKNSNWNPHDTQTLSKKHKILLTHQFIKTLQCMKTSLMTHFKASNTFASLSVVLSIITFNHSVHWFISIWLKLSIFLKRMKYKFADSFLFSLRKSCVTLYVCLKIITFP